MVFTVSAVFVHVLKVSGVQNKTGTHRFSLSIKDISLNIFYCVPQKKRKSYSFGT